MVVCISCFGICLYHVLYIFLNNKPVAVVNEHDRTGGTIAKTWRIL